MRVVSVIEKPGEDRLVKIEYDGRCMMYLRKTAELWLYKEYYPISLTVMDKHMTKDLEEAYQRIINKISKREKNGKENSKSDESNS